MAVQLSFFLLPKLGVPKLKCYRCYVQFGKLPKLVIHVVSIGTTKQSFNFSFQKQQLVLFASCFLLWEICEKFYTRTLKEEEGLKWTSLFPCHSISPFLLPFPHPVLYHPVLPKAYLWRMRYSMLDSCQIGRDWHMTLQFFGWLQMTGLMNLIYAIPSFFQNLKTWSFCQIVCFSHSVPVDVASLIVFQRVPFYSGFDII